MQTLLAILGFFVAAAGGMYLLGLFILRDELSRDEALARAETSGDVALYPAPEHRGDTPRPRQVAPSIVDVSATVMNGAVYVSGRNADGSKVTIATAPEARRIKFRQAEEEVAPRSANIAAPRHENYVYAGSDALTVH